MAQNAVTALGLPLTVDPSTALMGEVHRTAGNVAWLEQKIRGLAPEQLVRGISLQSTENGIVTKAEGAPAVSIWLEIYWRERQHLVEVSKVAIACGAVEQCARITEEQGRSIAAVIVGVLGDLGIDHSSDRVRSELRRRLLLVSGAAGYPASENAKLAQQLGKRTLDDAEFGPSTGGGSRRQSNW